MKKFWYNICRRKVKAGVSIGKKIRYCSLPRL
nr:MAG TPA: hypothetical protein [Caudoviricetes sp.]